MPQSLTLNNVFFILVKRGWIIVIVSLIGLLSAYFVSDFLLPERYTSKISLYVYNAKDDQKSPTIVDFNLSKQLVNTYIVILKSDSVLYSVANKVNLGYSSAQISNMIQTYPVEETEVFEVSVTSTKPEHSQLIANAIAEVGSKEIARIVKAGAVEIINTAKLPHKPSSPNVNRNSVIGLLVGFLLSSVFAIGLEFINTTVKDEADLVERYSLPVLGSIPSLENMENT